MRVWAPRASYVDPDACRVWGCTATTHSYSQDANRFWFFKFKNVKNLDMVP